MTAILLVAAFSAPVLLGLAIATKIYPAVLLPLLVLRAARRAGQPRGDPGLALTLGTAALVYLPFAIVAPDGVARSVWRQAERPLQIESLGLGRSPRPPPRLRDAARTGRRDRGRRT